MAITYVCWNHCQNDSLTRNEPEEVVIVFCRVLTASLPQLHLHQPLLGLPTELVYRDSESLIPNALVILTSGRNTI